MMDTGRRQPSIPGGEPVTGQPDRVVEPRFQQPARGQLREVLRHADAAALQLQQGDMLDGLPRTEDEAERSLLTRTTLVPVEPAQIELHLPLVRRLEASELQFDRDQPA